MMEHDMTEQKREPKDGERWWMKNTLTDSVFMTSYHTFRSNQFVTLAPVASYELVREMLEALETVQTHLYFRAEHIGRCTGDKNCSCGLELTKSEVVRALAKAKLAGLGE